MRRGEGEGEGERRREGGVCIASCRPRAGEALATAECCVLVEPLVLNPWLASLL